jgi:hypothetical protein
MTIIGFNFTKINAERKKPVDGQIKVQNSVKIDDVKESTLSVGDKKQKTLVFEFSYISTYQPEIGLIELRGILVYMTDQKKVEEIAKNWKSGKGKKLPEDVMAPVINTILNKCSITALQMSKEENLPPQIDLPKVKVSQ